MRAVHPTDLTVTNSTASEIGLAWTGGSTAQGYMLSYNVWRTPGDGVTNPNWGIIGWTDASTVTYNDTSISSNTEYAYYVTESNEGGTSLPSNQVTAPPPGSHGSSSSIHVFGNTTASGPDAPDWSHQVSGTIGGKVWVALEVTVAPLEKADARKVELEVEEDNAAMDPNLDDRRMDLAYDPAGSGWYQYDPTAGTWSLSAQSPAAVNTGTTAITYALPQKWDTTGETDGTLSLWDPTANHGSGGQVSKSERLMGHNKSHKIGLVALQLDRNTTTPLQIGFVDPDGTPYSGGPANTPVTLDNLVIASVSPAQVVLVPSGSTTPVNFQVDLADWDSSATYTITLTIRETKFPTIVIRTIQKTEGGLSHTLSWDLNDDAGLPVAPYGGYFTFDVSVSKPGDQTSYRSTFLTCTQDNLILGTDSDGNLLRDTSGKFEAIFQYKLSEAPAPKTVDVHFYQDLVDAGHEPDISDQSRWPPPVDAGVKHWMAGGESPSARGILSADDARGWSYRDCTNKHMLNWNSTYAGEIDCVTFTYTLSGKASTLSDNICSNNGGDLQEWQTQYMGDGLFLVPWEKTAYSWVCNSGGHGLMNSDKNRWCWSPHGPIPVNNGHVITVKESIVGCYHITFNQDDLSSYMPWSNKKNGVTEHNVGFFWRKKAEWGDDPDHNRALYITKPKQPWLYRAWRFDIHDEEGLDLHHPADPGHYGAIEHRGPSGYYRQTLRIHEDGGYPGTDGCIGVPPGMMGAVLKRFNDLRALIKAWNGWIGTGGSTDCLPLEVFDRKGPVDAAGELPFFPSDGRMFASGARQHV